MTEYWKSQARKYCDFCKCWLADNKVSISFHENGKKHKDNVKKHISDLSKRSAKEFKQKEKIDDDLKKMEEAAMAAYAKDIQNNADLTSKVINEKLGNSTDSIPVSGSSNSRPVWNEVKSNGKSYFWNTITNETTWDPPDEYVSLAQQEEEELKQKEKEKTKQKVKTQKQIRNSKERVKDCLKEVNAHLAREKMRELVDEEDQSSPDPVPFGPAPRPVNPYGSWAAVITQPVEQVDLQLPKSEKEVIPPPVIMEPEKTIEFKEKKVESLGEGPVEFKRRKLNNPKRHMRQKLDDDE